MGLCFFQTLEPQALQRRLLGVTDARFYFALAIRIAHAARQRDRSVVLEHIAIERIERGIVDVGCEYALAQVVQHDDPRDSAQTPEGLFVQLGPDTRTRPEHQDPHAFSAVAQREYEQACPPVTADLGIAYHRPGAVIDLRFLPRRCFNHRASFRGGSSAQLLEESFDALIAGREAVAIDQILPDRHRVAAARKPQLDHFAVGFTGAGGWAATRQRSRRDHFFAGR